MTEDEEFRTAASLRAEWDQAEATVSEWERAFDQPNPWARTQLEVAKLLIDFVADQEDK